MNALSPSNEDSHRAPTPQCDRYAENERGSCLHNAGGYRQPPCRCPYPRAPNTFSGRDRKSTRLNSSHGYISYAVFCLKKKTKNTLPSSTSITHIASHPTYTD